MGLVIWNESQELKKFFIFGFIVFLVGIFIEIIGVHTGFIFGSYTYGKTLGKQVYGVPLLIGVNWWIVLYACGCIIRQVVKRIKNNLLFAGIGATLATFFDYLLEPTAQYVGYWSWKNNHIPIYNYICWFIISFVLLTIFYKLKFRTSNRFVIILFILQLFFFLLLTLCNDDIYFHKLANLFLDGGNYLAYS